MGNDHSSTSMRHLTILLVAASTAALVVLIYHIMTVCWYNRRTRFHRPTTIGRSGPEEPSISMEHSMAGLIPAHKYQKGTGLVGEDGTCAVCLCEFEEGDELRTLPECVHSFHATCIDMWLYSHTTCPICRTDNTPSPLLRRISDMEAVESSATELHPNLPPNLSVHWGGL